MQNKWAIFLTVLLFTALARAQDIRVQVRPGGESAAYSCLLCERPFRRPCDFAAVCLVFRKVHAGVFVRWQFSADWYQNIYSYISFKSDKS